MIRLGALEKAFAGVWREDLLSGRYKFDLISFDIDGPPATFQGKIGWRSSDNYERWRSDIG